MHSMYGNARVLGVIISSDLSFETVCMIWHLKLPVLNAN